MRARVQGQGLGGCKVMAMTALCRQLVVLVLVVLVVLVFLDDLVPPRLPGVDGCAQDAMPVHPAQTRDWLWTCTPRAHRRAERPPQKQGPAQLACAASCCPRRFERRCRSKFAPRCRHWRAQTHIFPRSLLRVRGC